MGAHIFAIANQKGGVGKTTTAINLAACLAEAGERSLVVDLDPQANATSGLGERANGSSSIDLLDGAPLRELAKPTRFANLDLVPAKPDLAGTATELARRGDGERYLAEALAAANGDYSFVFVDCPLGRADPGSLEPPPRDRGRDSDHGRPADAACRGRGCGSAAALRQPRLQCQHPAVGADCRGAEPWPSRDRIRPPLGRSRRVLEGGDGACRPQLSGAIGPAGGARRLQSSARRCPQSRP